tara:strand:+ start:4320 stop:4580 length:261 start_codon:yes stop_codon:yes gene_type:complete
LPIRANKTKRLRGKLTAYLKTHKTASSRELLDHFNKENRQGSTMNSMTNVLAKDPRFKVVGQTRVAGNAAGGKYSMLLWGLVDEEE